MPIVLSGTFIALNIALVTLIAARHERELADEEAQRREEYSG